MSAIWVRLGYGCRLNATQHVFQTFYFALGTHCIAPTWFCDAPPHALAELLPQRHITPQSSNYMSAEQRHVAHSVHPPSPDQRHSGVAKSAAGAADE